MESPRHGRDLAIPFRMSRKQDNPTGKQGIAAVECAVALPVLLLIVAASVDICNLIFLRQHLTVAAYEGARTAINKNTDLEDVEAQVQTILDERGIVAEVTVSPNNFESADFGTPIEVYISADASQNTIFRGIFSRDKTVSAQLTMMKEH